MPSCHPPGGPPAADRVSAQSLGAAPPMVAHSFHVLLALLAPALAPQAANSTVRFRVKVLETLGGTGIGLQEQATAINDQGELAGNVVYGGNSIAAYWSANGALTLLANGQTDACSLAFDLSDDGIAVGRIVGGLDSEPFQWTASTGKQPIALAPGAVPLAINGFQTIGYSFPSEPSLSGATWRQGVVTSITGASGDVLVRDVNALGAVTGIVGGGELPARAFRWSPAAGFVELPLPAGFVHAHGNGLNDANVVVGLSRTPDRDQATRWNPSSAPLLLPYARAEDSHSAALAINADGWIVGVESDDPLAPGGSRGVVWIDGQALALSDCLAPLPHGMEVHVSAAFDVNATGQIAARGLVNGVERALRLDP
jgi:hypothetical protein